LIKKSKCFKRKAREKEKSLREVGSILLYSANVNALSKGGLQKRGTHREKKKYSEAEREKKGQRIYVMGSEDWAGVLRASLSCLVSV